MRLRAIVVAPMLSASLLAAPGDAGHPPTRAQVQPSRDPARLRAGVFLFAAPAIGDPRFAETVILLLDHGASGSAGVVINQPGEVTLRRMLPDLPEARRLEVPVYWGGPVEPGAMVVLLRAPRRTTDATPVLPDVHRTNDLEALRSALEDARPDRQVRVYSGYAGWSPGQLEQEVRLGAWVLDRGDADSVFTLDPGPLWNRVHSILKRLEARLAPADGRGDLPSPASRVASSAPAE